jgi:hypothetical protein
MASIYDIIKREINPFDINLKPMNFWRETQNSALTVESIHQEAIVEIEGLLDLVTTDNCSRTVLLIGDSGSGKSHLLGRLKRTLNPKAFFAYILCNWADSGNIWRHILRHTVDSLIEIPEGQQESQLMLWLKSLSAFTKRSLKERFFNHKVWQLLQSDRQKFIQHLKQTYKKAAIYNPDIFFGVLHDLTNPELYDLACEWLRGDDLSEESMQTLKVRHCIDTEDVAKNILANFGKISTETQPVVLCFENLETLPKLPDGFLDIQPLFDVNTTIHGDSLKNLLVIISIVTNTWNRHSDKIQQSDKAGIYRKIKLKLITLEQAEALWAYQLKYLHQQANPQPASNIFPLTRQILEQNFPGGKTLPRNAFILGRQEYHKYKLSITQKPEPIKVVINYPSKPSQTANGEKIIKRVIEPGSTQPPSISSLEPTISERIKAEFELLWQQEYQKVQGKNTKIALLAAPDLIRMLQQALEALQVQEIKPKLISGKYATNSLSYQQLGKRERIGVVWTEESHMNTFFNIMNACKTAIQKNLCQTLYLIRAGNLGTPNLVGNQLYRQIFTSTNHVHIKPNLTSVHYLATYHSFVNSALANELVLAGKTITLQELQTLTRECNILQKCTLLQELKMVSPTSEEKDNGNGKHDLQPVKNLMLNLVKTQSFIGLPSLIKETKAKFSLVKESEF